MKRIRDKMRQKFHDIRRQNVCFDFSFVLRIVKLLAKAIRMLRSGFQALLRIKNLINEMARQLIDFMK